MSDAGALASLEERLRQRARQLGFAACGLAPVTPLAHNDVFQGWLDAGHAGSMSYLERTRDQRADPRQLLPSAATAIVVVASYATGNEEAPRPGYGTVARYARGMDYHHLLRAKLTELDSWLRAEVGGSVESRIVVDTAPLLERELAMAAGCGFIGKNTMLITPGVGSYTVLGTLLTSVSLQPDRPATSRCGSCDLCLRACPTNAFTAPRSLDARRCISYLTIEHRGAIDASLMGRVGSWVFGCDACQQVCPYNHPASTRSAPPPIPELLSHVTTPASPPSIADGGALDLAELLALRSGAYRRLTRGRALARASRSMWQRNAAIAASDRAHPDVNVDDGLEDLSTDEDPVLSTTARWALARRAK